MIYERVQAICKEKGMTIAELERAAGLTNGTIGKWRTSSPTVKSLQAVANVLKVKVQKLIV